MVLDKISWQWENMIKELVHGREGAERKEGTRDLLLPARPHLPKPS
jgi:hypothetical protein